MKLPLRNPATIRYIIISVFIVIVAGCKSTQTRQMSGTELVQDRDGHSKLVTYVTPEEYERMTPEERQRMNVAQGASVSLPLSGSKATPEAISEEDFKKAYAK